MNFFGVENNKCIEPEPPFLQEPDLGIREPTKKVAALQHCSHPNLEWGKNKKKKKQNRYINKDLNMKTKYFRENFFILASHKNTKM